MLPPMFSENSLWMVRNVASQRREMNSSLACASTLETLSLKRPFAHTLLYEGLVVVLNYHFVRLYSVRKSIKYLTLPSLDTRWAY